MTPDVALIGWPKSGTDSLYAWLGAHPGIQPSTPKEPFFFMDPENPLCGRYGASFAHDGPEAYARFFDGPAEGRLRFEATTHSYYQRTARECFAASGGPLVVAALRRPEDRLRSAFHFWRDTRANVDRGLGFAEYAQALLDCRVESLRSRFKLETTFWIAARQLEFSNYAEWLAQWRDAVGRERLFIALFEDFRARPAETLARLCARLGLDPAFYDGFDFRSENPTIRIRHAALHRAARRLAGWVPQTALRAALRRAYLAVQKQGPVARADEDEQGALAMLARRFEVGDRALEERFGLDLSAWGEARAAGGSAGDEAQ